MIKSISNAIVALGGLIDDLHLSKEEKLQIRLKMAEIQQKLIESQNVVNMIQSQHRSTFVAGARPTIMYICAMGLFVGYVMNPILSIFGLTMLDVPLDHVEGLLIPILGIGGLRTYEKLKAVSR